METAPAVAPVASPETPVIPDRNSGMTPAVKNLFSGQPAPKQVETIPAKAPEVKAPEVKTVVPPEKKTEPVAKTTPAGDVVVPAPEEDEKFLKEMAPGTRNRFNEVLKRQLSKELENKMKDVKQITPEIETEISTYKKTNEELLTELRKVGIERSPEYLTKYVERPKAIKESLTELVKPYSIDGRDIFNLIDAGTPEARLKLNELLENVGRVDTAEAVAFIREYQELQKGKVAIQKDQDTAIKLLSENRDKETKAYVEKLVTDRRTALTKDVLPIVEQESDSLIFQGEDGQTLKAGLMDSIRKTNDIDLERMPPKDRAAMIASAFLAKPYYNAYVAEKARTADLTKKLQAYEQAEPGLGGRASEAGTSESDEDKASTFTDRLRRGKL